MKITCISDLHGHSPELEGGDLLIIAGDLTSNDELIEYQKFCDWIHRQNYKKKIVIGGNHDAHLENEPFKFDEAITNCVYLCDSGTEFEGVKIWGTPWTMSFDGMNKKCRAFTKPNERKLSHKWNLIPSDTQILICHSPPYGVMDEVFRYGDFEAVGSMGLRTKIHKINPRIVVFGHIHECYGFKTSFYTTYINASHVDEDYQPVNKPITIELEFSDDIRNKSPIS